MESNDEYSLMRIISQYNHNQEDYHKNMTSLIDIMQQQRSDVYTFEFGVSDAASALLSLFDPSRNLTSRSNASTRLSETDISCGTTVFSYTSEMLSLICPITLESVQPGDSVMQINNCRHRFKETALRRWFDNNQRCPVCRGLVNQRVF